ncbi:MAG: hypothetical protein JWR69_3415 [Pedosphaera sp.]|nr:hypothetical protein [Pedosphaera sp.]
MGNFHCSVSVGIRLRVHQPFLAFPEHFCGEFA